MADDSKKGQELAEEKALLTDLISLNKEAAKQVKELEAAERKLSIARRTNSGSTAKLELNVKNLNKSLTANAREIQNQREAVKKAEESLELYNKRIDALASSAEGATGAMDKLFGTNMSSYIDRTKTLGLSFSGMMNQLVDYGKELDEVNVGMARTTGFGNALQGAFNKAHLEIGQFAGNMQELGEAMGQLSVEYSRFNALSEDQMAAMAAQGVQFQKLGVSATQFAQTQEALSYAFGVTDNAMLGATSNLDKFSMSIGTVPSRVLEDLTSLAPTLARFGQSGIGVFKNLAREARQLGLTTQAAFDLTEMFDTFEGSANAAGRLNAQLGLQLNSVELMTADSDERLEILRQEFQLQGKSFKAMGKRDRQMVADILGVDEMTAGKALGGKMSLGSLAKETERKPEDFATMAEVGKAIEEGKFKRQNFLITKQTNELKGAGMNLASMTGILGNIQIGLTVIAGLIAARSAFNVARGLKNRLGGGKGGPGAKTPTTPRQPKAPPTKAQTKQLSIVKQLKAERGIGSQAALKLAKSGVMPKAMKTGAKGLGKSFIKKIPLLGLGAGILFGAQRAMAGDFAGAAMEIASGAASTLPGMGTAASVGIDAALMARDMGAFDSKASAPSGPSGMSSMSRSAKASRAAKSQPMVIKGGQTHVTIDIDGKPLRKVIVDTAEQSLNPMTPVSAM